MQAAAGFVHGQGRGQERQAARAGQGHHLCVGALAVDVEDGLRVDHLGGVRRLEVRQPGDEERPVTAEGQDLAHQVGGEAAGDLPIKGPVEVPAAPCSRGA